RPNHPEQADDLLQRALGVEDAQVAFLHAVVGRPQEGGRVLAFDPAHGGDLLGGQLGRAAIARRHAGDVHLPAVLLGQPDEGAAAEELGIVGVGEEAEDRVAHGRLGTLARVGAGGTSGPTMPGGGADIWRREPRPMRSSTTSRLKSSTSETPSLSTTR